MVSYKILFFTSCLSLLLCSCGKKTKLERTITLTDLGWSFRIPADIVFKDSSFDGNGKLTGNYQKVLALDILTVFTLAEDDSNWLTSSIVRDTLDYKSWSDFHAQDNKLYFKEIANMKRFLVIDTVYTEEVIGGFNFKKEYIKCYSETKNDTIWSYHYDAKFQSYNLSVDLSFTKKKVGEKLLNIFNSSKFR